MTTLHYEYWIDDGLEIRTCKECRLSKFKSPDDGEWMLYFTEERKDWALTQLGKRNYTLHCDLCNKCSIEETEKHLFKHALDTLMSKGERVGSSPVREAYWRIE